MTRVAPVNLTFNPRTLWFDPGDLDVKKDDAVVVRTARGTEFGIAASDVIEVEHERVAALKTPLRPVERLATEEDVEQARAMEERSREALPVFKEMARESNEDMHPVSVEFLLDGDKAVFYFEAEERIDFRDLVRKLASRFHVRIDMRQIGVRDEARMVGGLGHCGQELCCKRLGGEFCPVSIRMAKEQGLSLNPQKISGVCGRLMCCLRYEYEAYKDFRSRAPKQNATVSTPDGPAKVVSLDVPREVVSLKVEGEKPVDVPLADFEPPEPGSNRPNAVGEEAWKEAQADHGSLGGDNLIFSTSQFTGSDKLAEGPKVRHTGGRRKSESAKGKEPAGRRGKQSGGRGSKNQASAAPPRRRRRSTKLAAGEDGHALERVSTSKASGDDAAKGSSSGGRKPRSVRRGDSRRQGAAEGSSKTKGQNRQGGARPGQKSSGLRQGQDQKRPAASKGQAAGGNKDAAASEGQQRRRRRRRSRKPKDSGTAGSAGDQGRGPKDSPSA